MATGPSTKQPRVSVGGSSEIPLNVEETDLSKLAASIVAPSGKEEPCELKRLENGQTGWRTFFCLTVSFRLLCYHKYPYDQMQFSCMLWGRGARA